MKTNSDILLIKEVCVCIYVIFHKTGSCCYHFNMESMQGSLVLLLNHLCSAIMHRGHPRPTFFLLLWFPSGLNLNWLCWMAIFIFMCLIWRLPFLRLISFAYFLMANLYVYSAYLCPPHKQRPPMFKILKPARLTYWPLIVLSTQNVSLLWTLKKQPFNPEPFSPKSFLLLLSLLTGLPNLSFDITT